MKSSNKGGAVAPFAALGLLAVCTVTFGLWNRGLIPSVPPIAPSPSPSPLSTAPYYVQLYIGKKFDEEKNLVLEVPFTSDGKQHKVYEKKKGRSWSIDVRAQRATDATVSVQTRVVRFDKEYPNFGLTTLTDDLRYVVDAPLISQIDSRTGKEPPTATRWDVRVSSLPSQEAVGDSRYLR
jgi:hypothetical protein